MRRAIFSLAVCLCVAFGCSQDEGERCEVNGDCASGLECQVPASANPPSGTCVKPGTAAPGGDAAAVDRTPDAPPQAEPPVEPAVEPALDAAPEAASDVSDEAAGDSSEAASG